MQGRRRIGMTLLGVTVLVTPAISAQDWPQWRGPGGSNLSAESGWSVAGSKQPLWSTEVGLGYSSVVIRDGRLVTAGHAEKAKKDSIYCLDAASGKTIWTHTFAAECHKKYHTGGTLSTPTIDGDRVYVLNREGRFMCLSFEDGSVIWEKLLQDEYELNYPEWMFAASPVIHGEKVIVNVGRVLALNKNTGSEIWATRDAGDAYSTPILMAAHGGEHLLVFNGDGLFVFDPANGEELSSYTWKTKYDINAATPVIDGNRIFISSGYNHGCAMLELTEEGLQSVWESKEMRSHMSGCVLFEGNLYGFDDSTLKCLGTDGEEKWAERGFGEGALMIADGKLLVLTSKGDLIIADATPDGFSQIARARVLEGGVYWTSPVLANGLIYCRNSKGKLVCRDHRSRER